MVKKQVHVHIHSERAPTRDGDDEGRWVTISGARVFIGKGGKIEKGPSALVGKSATGEHLDAAQRHKEQGSRKGEKHGDFWHHLNAMHSHTGAAIHANKPESEEYGKHAAEAAAHEAKLGKKENKEGGKPGHGGKTVGANAHKLLDPGFKKTMDPGQRALTTGTSKQENLAPRQAMLREQGSPRYAGRTNENPAKPERPPSKAALRGQAKGEHELASRGHGSYARAADLYEQAGDTDKAEGARALARRYGHTPEAVKARNQADKDAASTARAQASRAPSTKVRELLMKKADLHEQMVAESGKYPAGSDGVTKQLRSLTDEIAHHESRAQMGNGADLDDMRAAIRKDSPDISMSDLNAEMEKRLKK